MGKKDKITYDDEDEDFDEDEEESDMPDSEEFEIGYCS